MARGHRAGWSRFPPPTGPDRPLRCRRADDHRGTGPAWGASQISSSSSPMPAPSGGVGAGARLAADRSMSDKSALIGHGPRPRPALASRLYITKLCKLGAGRSSVAGGGAGIGHTPHPGPRRLRRGDVARPVRPLPPPDKEARVALRLAAPLHTGSRVTRSLDHPAPPDPPPAPRRGLGRRRLRTLRASRLRRLVLGPPQPPAPSPRPGS